MQAGCRAGLRPARSTGWFGRGILISTPDRKTPRIQARTWRGRRERAALMGQEALCTARFGGQSGTGRALLETEELIFRGAFRLNVPFASVQSVEAVEGALRVCFTEGEA